MPAPAFDAVAALRGARGLRGLEILRRDAPARARAGDQPQIDARFARLATRGGRRRDTARAAAGARAAAAVLPTAALRRRRCGVLVWSARPLPAQRGRRRWRCARRRWRARGAVVAAAFDSVSNTISSAPTRHHVARLRR